MSNVKEVTDQTFKAEVLEAQLPVMVDFWAPWCGPCRMLSPLIEALGEKYADKLNTVKLNTDENPQTSSQYRITGIPTLIIFKAGKEIERIVGFLPQNALEEKFRAYIA
jgi:thioredoxin 1